MILNQKFYKQLQHSIISICRVQCVSTIKGVKINIQPLGKTCPSKARRLLRCGNASLLLTFSSPSLLQRETLRERGAPRTKTPRVLLEARGYRTLRERRRSALLEARGGSERSSGVTNPKKTPSIFWVWERD